MPGLSPKLPSQPQPTGPVAYTVVATLPNQPLAKEYARWLADDHIAKVLASGASSAVVVEVTDPATPIRVESRYTFPNREALDAYLTRHAPDLRAEGLAKFPPESGVRWERSIGLILAQGGAPHAHGNLG